MKISAQITLIKTAGILGSVTLGGFGLFSLLVLNKNGAIFGDMAILIFRFFGCSGRINRFGV